MTKQEQLDFIRSRCIAANPEIEERSRFNRLHEVRVLPIRLADLLLAIDGLTAGKVPGNDFAYIRKGNVRSKWLLTKDDLTEQSNECVSFLYDLLQ